MKCGKDRQAHAWRFEMSHRNSSYEIPEVFVVTDQQGVLIFITEGLFQDFHSFLANTC